MKPLMIRQQDTPLAGGGEDFADAGERDSFLQKDNDPVATVLFPDDDVERASSIPETEQQVLAQGSNRERRASLVEWVIESVKNLYSRASSDAPSVAAGSESSFSRDDSVTTQHANIDGIMKVLKNAYSATLLVFSIYVVMLAVFSGQTTLSKATHPAIAFVVLWSLILWLGMMEGGQGCLVGLQPVNKGLYAHSHPIAHKCTKLAHKGDNMHRFIVGRQFLVTMVVFVINLCCSTVIDATIGSLSDTLIHIFLGSGLATMLITVMLGQLTAQVNATNCMLDFINTYFMVFSTWASLIIEMSGLLHSVYVVQYVFAVCSGKAVVSEEPPRSIVANIFFWFRVLVSSVLLAMSFAVTLTALFEGKTRMFEGVPAFASTLAYFGLMCFVGLMEGMQIALFAVVNMPQEELKQHPVALANCRLTFSGSNFQAFLIGRQICVTICTFLIARITTISVITGAGAENNIFHVSNSMQAFFNTGLPGALVATVVGSLAWRIIASSFPLAFMSNPLIYVTIRLCLFLEASGVCSAAWVLAAVHKRLVGFELDEVYIGTFEGSDAFFEEDLSLSEPASISESGDPGSPSLVDRSPGPPSLVSYGSTSPI